MLGMRIVNMKTYKPQASEVLIKVDRSSPLGNPFYMDSERERDLVCNKYHGYFKTAYKMDAKFKQAFLDIYATAQTHNVALGCWCFPKRCHAETILKYLIAYEKWLRNQ